MARMRRLLAMVIMVCWLGAGCGGADGDGEAATTATTAASSASSTTAGATTSSEAAATTAGFAGTLIEVRVTGRKVETANRRVRIDRGQKVRIQVQADRPEEVHVHGYNLKADVAPGKPATVEFTADLPGLYEVELEQARLKLVELQVQ